MTTQISAIKKYKSAPSKMNKSVKFINPRKSVIETAYVIVKAPGGEIKVES